MLITINQQNFSNVIIQKNNTVKNSIKHKSLSTTQNPYSKISGVYHPIFNGLKPLPTKLERFKGCLLGGAIGDAFGAPIEFKTLDEIKKKYGIDGLKELYSDLESGYANITDDTQLTIFTIDGLLRAIPNRFTQVKRPDPKVVYNSYQKWFTTQNEPYNYQGKPEWIENIKDLYAVRDPGNTCLQALRANQMGTIENPINNSKGSGCIMRVAPIGLLYNKNSQMAFEVASENAAMTHGHPSAQIASGVMAALISELNQGQKFTTALNNVLLYLKSNYSEDKTTEVTNKLNQAIKLAQSKIKQEKAIKLIGEGWTAEEALAISIYCILKNNVDFKKSILASINHSGDSDTTGAITGNLIGACVGINKIPTKWIQKVQFNSLLQSLANDLYRASNQEISELRNKYPINNGKTPNWYIEKIDDNEKTHSIEEAFTASEIEELQNLSLEERVRQKKLLINKQIKSNF